MASPMNWFRHHQKIFLAVLGILCMVGFVVFEPLYKMLTNTGSSNNPIAVRTSFGNVTESDLQNMVRSRAALNRFLEAVTGITAEQMVQSGQMQLPPQQIQYFLLQQMQAAGIYGPQLATEQNVVRIMLLNHEAESLGMNISNKAAYEWLQQLTMDRITPDQLRQIMEQLGVSQTQIFDELRSALLSRSIQEAIMHINSVQGAPPGVRWNYFQRLHREVNAEILPLLVADFIAQVSEPDEAILKGLFEKYKNDYSMPGRIEPGFRVPAKGRFQGFKAPYDALASTVEVTDAEIAKFYDEHKEEFRTQPQFGTASPTGEAPPTDAVPGAESAEPAAPAADGEAPAKAETPASTEPSTTEPAPTETAPTARSENAPESPATTSPSEPAPAPPAEENSSPETPKSETPPSPNQGGGGDDAASAESTDSNPDTSAESGAAEPSTDTEPSTNTEPSSNPEAPATSDTPAEPGTTSETAASDAPATEAPATETPAADPPATTEPTDAADTQIEPSAESQLPGGLTAPPSEFEPLEKVSDRIRQTLTSQQVDAKVDTMFSDLSAIMNKYAQDVELYEIEKEEQGPNAKDLKEPAPLDFKQLAGQYKIEAFQTEMISPFDAAALDVGQTTVDGRPFREAAFGGMGQYGPRRGQDLAGNRYLFWKTEASHSKVPTFEEARQEVLDAWKLIEARKLATERAAELAKQASEQGKSLKDLFGSDPKYTVTDTGFFTWMTEQSLASQFGAPQIRLSQVTGVEGAGPDFMQAVFSLPPGQAGSAMNADESVAYVVRVLEQRPNQEELMNEFVKSNYQQYMPTAQFEMRDFSANWVKQLELESNLAWERPMHDDSSIR